jgi:hypothetical protein
MSLSKSSLKSLAEKKAQREQLPKVIPLILEQIRQETESEWQRERQRNVFRGSELGNCPRAIQYAVLGYKPERPGPELALLFRDGHLHHDQLRLLLSKIGILTNVEQGGYKDYTVDGLGFGVTGTMDGLYNKEYLIDIKSINHFSFQTLTRDIIRQNYIGYLYQLHMYLDIFGMDKGFLLFKNKNTSELRLFWYDKDEEIIKEVLDKLSVIVKAGEVLIKRPYEAKSKECRRCFMRIHCWEKSMDRREWGHAQATR